MSTANGRNETPDHKSAVNGGIRSNVLRVVDMEKHQKESQTFGERLSEVIAAFAGSMLFVYLHIGWFGLWIVLNTLMPERAFDPFPFTFLTLVVSLEAIFLSTFILINQNHETRLTERRNHLDLQINLLAEQENTKMLELLTKIGEKVGVDQIEDLDDLLEPADPESMLNEILNAKEAETADVAQIISESK